MPKKRGGQPNNKNAYKHGFYSQQFRAGERSALARIPVSDLSGEIEFVRVYLKRFLGVQNASPQPLDLESQLAVLRAVTLSSESINGMIRTQFILAQANKESDEIISRLMQPPDDEDGGPEDSASQE